MKISNHSKFLLLLLLFSNAILVKAQQHWLPCGNGRIDTAADRAAERFAQLHKNIQAPSNAIRVYFHVFSNDDGSNIAATPDQVISEYASLRASYAADNLCFIQMGVQYINSTTLNNNFNADTDPNGNALSSDQVSGCINIFYMQAIRGTNTACNPPCGYGGIALGGIPGTFCLIATGNIGGSNTIGHEVGHCLGLLHTFEPAYGLENINGSNSSTAADKVSDTNADPYVFSGQSCFSATSCNYTGYCTDPNGASNYSPPYTNLMSYWGCGNPAATNGQFARVNSFLASTTALVNCSSPSNFILPNSTVSSGMYLRSAINTLTNGTNNSIFSNSTIAIFGAAVNILSPGFQAIPTTGYTQIIASPCY